MILAVYTIVKSITCLTLFQVNNEEKWEELLVLFNVPRFCTNGAQALKQIYSRLVQIMTFLSSHLYLPDY